MPVRTGAPSLRDPVRDCTPTPPASQEEALSNALPQPDAAHPVPVLLVAEQERIRTELESLLREALPHARLTWVRQAAQAAATAHELAPALVLVDNDLLHDDPVSLLRRLAQELPQTLLLALVEAHDPVEARQSLAAGARGLLTKPVQLADLQAKLAELPPVTPAPTPAPSPPPSPTPVATNGHVIAVLGAKGGVGCTTLAANLAVELHQQTGGTLLLLEADCAAPTLGATLNVWEGPTWQATLDALDATDPLSEESTSLPWGVPHATGIHILPAPTRAALEAPPSAAQAHRLVSALRRRFAWSVLDLGVIAHPFAAALLEVADRVLVVTVPELPALHRAQVWLEQLTARDAAPDSVRIVLNRAGLRGAPALVDIEERLRLRVRHVLPDDPAAVTRSLNRGVPLVLSHPQAALSHSVAELSRALVEEMVGGVVQPVQPLRRGPARLFARLWGA